MGWVPPDPPREPPGLHVNDQFAHHETSHQGTSRRVSAPPPGIHQHASLYGQMPFHLHGLPCNAMSQAPSATGYANLSSPTAVAGGAASPHFERRQLSSTAWLGPEPVEFEPRAGDSQDQIVATPPPPNVACSDAAAVEWSTSGEYAPLAARSQTGRRVGIPEPFTAAQNERWLRDLHEPIPLNDRGELSSIGSLSHASGSCVPCVFWFQLACASGVRCTYCHLAHPGYKKKRIRPSKRTRLELQALRSSEPRADQVGRGEAHRESRAEPHSVQGMLCADVRNGVVLYSSLDAPTNGSSQVLLTLSL